MKQLIVLLVLLNLNYLAYSDTKLQCKILEKNAFLELRNYKASIKSDQTSSTLIKREFITTVTYTSSKEISQIIITTNESMGPNNPSLITNYRMEFDTQDSALKVYEDISSIITEVKK